MEVLKKIQKARVLIKAKELKKAGHNDYSNYDYYTPEQVEHLVHEACTEVGLINKYDLLRTELGLTARLLIYDIESGEKEEFSIATEIPDIKATNIAQQLGGAVTYSERYLKMIAFEIKDNSIDFDAQKPPQKTTDKGQKKDDLPWLNKWTGKDKKEEKKEYWTIVNRAKEKGITIAELRNHYKISKEIETELNNDL